MNRVKSCVWVQPDPRILACEEAFSIAAGSTVFVQWRDESPRKQISLETAMLAGVPEGLLTELRSAWKSRKYELITLLRRGTGLGAQWFAIGKIRDEELCALLVCPLGLMKKKAA